MRYKYKLKRVINSGEDFKADLNLAEYIRKSLQSSHPREFIEQDLGIDPIPVKDFLFNQLVV